MNNQTLPSGASIRRPTTRGACLSIVALAMITGTGCGQSDRQTTTTQATTPQSPSTGDTSAPTGVVTVQIKTADGVNSIDVANVADGKSLESVMRQLPGVDVSVKGSGTTAFVDRIGDVATSAGQGWTFQVDGEWSDKGVGKTELHPPTTVTWEFGNWDAAK
ncbi:MAG: DUF4430 domain-containing protein [Pirellulaceae bacterium]|nr:DUF4430 domain-containing protein [Pirellulaceae bacterium]